MTLEDYVIDNFDGDSRPVINDVDYNSSKEPKIIEKDGKRVLTNIY